MLLSSLLNPLQASWQSFLEHTVKARHYSFFENCINSQLAFRFFIIAACLTPLIFIQKPERVSALPPSLIIKSVSMPSYAEDEMALKGSRFFGLETDANATASSPKSASLDELTKDYRLKGIVSGDEPEAIIEDARTQKTFFVAVGGKLGDLTVKKIGEGNLLVARGNEEKEMRLDG